MSRKNVEKNESIEHEIENIAPPMKKEKIMKSPEERAAIFAKNLSHESDRVSEWMGKLGSHLTSNLYGVSESKAAEILARFEKDVVIFHDKLEKAKNKGSDAVAKPQMVTVSDVIIKAKV